MLYTLVFESDDVIKISLFILAIFVFLLWNILKMKRQMQFNQKKMNRQFNSFRLWAKYPWERILKCKLLCSVMMLWSYYFQIPRQRFLVCTYLQTQKNNIHYSANCIDFCFRLCKIPTEGLTRFQNTSLQNKIKMDKLPSSKVVFLLNNKWNEIPLP